MKLIITICMSMTFLFAWKGYNKDTDSYIKIIEPNKVRTDAKILYHDHLDNIEKYGVVKSIQRTGIGTKVKIIDQHTKQIKTFWME